MLMNRRSFLKWLGGLALTGATVGTYAAVIEPDFLLRTQYYAFTPPNWSKGLKLRLVLLADPHLCEPYVPPSRWRRIIDFANSVEADLALLLGDYTTHHAFITARVPVAEAAKGARFLEAPLGTYAITGNHDWWEDRAAQKRRSGPNLAQIAFEAVGIPVLENKAIRLSKDQLPFWLTGTSSMIALHNGYLNYTGLNDLPGTLAQVTDQAPIIHMAHEPDLFVSIPDRVSVTLSGHTHGGQVRLFGYSPIVPSEYGNRFAYGHIIENNRHLIVSGGLGCSVMPVRFGVPPEIVVLDLG